MTYSAWRLVIAFVGLIGLTAVLGIIVLTAQHDPSPNILDVIAASALTGLVGLLANPREDVAP
jgi:hypothetical protein